MQYGRICSILLYLSHNKYLYRRTQKDTLLQKLVDFINGATSLEYYPACYQDCLHTTHHPGPSARARRIHE
jgi:hypothetical protein